METQLGAMTGLERANGLPAHHPFSVREGRTHRFVARKDSARVRDRQDIAVDDEPDEVHHPVRRRVDETARGDVDAAMTGRIPRRCGDERPHNLVRSPHRPCPPRFGRLGGCSNGDSAGHQAEEKRESKHPLIVAMGEAWTAPEWEGRAQPARNAAGGGAVLPLTKHPAPLDDYACL